MTELREWMIAMQLHNDFAIGPVDGECPRTSRWSPLSRCWNEHSRKLGWDCSKD